ncbi:MAG: class I SAM-dependent methyltransferase [Actinomycetota bacterium]|nr:class I SAM-dependent methyltransferase [Actinomycetota bacterium]
MLRAVPGYLARDASARGDYVHALRFERLTGVYDPIVRLTTREGAFKRRLLDQAALGPGQRVLDVGCGAGTLAVRAARSRTHVRMRRCACANAEEGLG